MPIHIELTVCTVQDLATVEMRLRELQRASAGVPCQALLTTEYQVWRHEVIKQLAEKQLAERDGRKQPCLEAYIQGFHLLYEQNKCSVSQVLPSIVINTPTHDRVRKRKVPSPETISARLDI